MVKVANKDCRQYVEDRLPFRGSNLHGESSPLGGPGMYVVYSYGWYPILAYVGGKWYCTTDKYSATTAKHISQATPNVEDVIYVDQRTLWNGVY